MEAYRNLLNDIQECANLENSLRLKRSELSAKIPLYLQQARRELEPQVPWALAKAKMLNERMNAKEQLLELEDVSDDMLDVCYEMYCSCTGKPMLPATLNQKQKEPIMFLCFCRGQLINKLSQLY